MISVIIASANSRLLEQVKTNIEETIGVAYEVIAFDNRDGAEGICRLYNKGTALAKYGILCYMHEDVALKTAGWGKVVRDLFERQPTLGIVGISGSVYKSVMPTGWWSAGAIGSERTNLLQSFKHMHQETLRSYANPGDEAWARVVAVDGAWMCARKEVAEKHRFDGETFTGFHCYDVDFCLSAGRDYGIAVTYEILLHHFSEGKFDKQWMEDTLLLYRKWEQELPKSIVPVSKSAVRKIEKKNFLYWVKQMRFLGFGQKAVYQLLHRPKLYGILGLKYYVKLHVAVLSVYSGKKNKPNETVFQ